MDHLAQRRFEIPSHRGGYRLSGRVPFRDGGLLLVGPRRRFPVRGFQSGPRLLLQAVAVDLTHACGSLKSATEAAGSRFLQDRSELRTWTEKFPLRPTLSPAGHALPSLDQWHLRTSAMGSPRSQSAHCSRRLRNCCSGFSCCFLVRIRRSRKTRRIPSNF